MCVIKYLIKTLKYIFIFQATSLLALITLSNCFEGNTKIRRANKRGIISSIYPHHGVQNSHIPGHAVVYNNHILPHRQTIVGQNKIHGQPVYYISEMNYGQPMSLVQVNNHVSKSKKLNRHPNQKNKTPKLYKTSASNIHNSVDHEFKFTPVYHHLGQSYGHNLIHSEPEIIHHPSYTVGQSFKVSDSPIIIGTPKPKENLAPVMVQHVPVPYPIHQMIPEAEPVPIPIKQYQVIPKRVIEHQPIIQHEPVYQHVKMIPHYPITHNVPTQDVMVQNPVYAESEDDESVKPVHEEEQNENNSGGHSYSYYTSVSSKSH